MTISNKGKFARSMLKEGSSKTRYFVDLQAQVDGIKDVKRKKGE